MGKNLNHVIIDLYPFSQFLIEYLKKSCTVNLSHFLTNMIYSTRNSMVFRIIVQQNTLFQIIIVNKIRENLDKGKFLCGVFIDLQKAFDTVNHYILLQKLNHYVRVCVVIYDWFHSYLIERTLSTLSDNLESHHFADDTNLLYADKKLKSLETTVKSNYRKFASG